MELVRIETPGLAHYSYVLGDPDSNVAAVVDPRRDIDAYLAYAARRDCAITHIFETHIHADFCSGARELGAATKAPIHVSGHDGDESFTVAFPHYDLKDGDTVDVGTIRVRALHTPGHTPEHLSFLIFDGSGRDPTAFLTGDFLFVGSLGRPDLLGEDQKLALARRMYETVRSTLPPLRDDLKVFPAHGAGSMCGAGMSGRAESTIGLERAANPYLAPRLSESEFVGRLLADVPAFPPYYRRMKRVNAAGPNLLAGRRRLAELGPDAIEQLIARGAVVIDVRDSIPFGAGHVPGSLGIGLGSQLPVWAAWLVPYETPIILVGSSSEDSLQAALLLSRVGLDDVAGALAGGIRAWSDSGRTIATLPQISPSELARTLSAGMPISVLDVRSDREWRAGHIPRAIHEFGGTIHKHFSTLPDRNASIVVTCGGGYRSTAVASVLKRSGYTRITNLAGGMGGWNHAGLPVASGETIREGRFLTGFAAPS